MSCVDGQMGGVGLSRGAKEGFERKEVCVGCKTSAAFPVVLGLKPGRPWPCAQLGTSGLPSLVLTSGKEAFFLVIV